MSTPAVVYFCSLAEYTALGVLRDIMPQSFLVLIFVPAWSHAAENRSNACWRPCWEDPRMQYQISIHPQRVNGSSCISQQWHLRRRICGCLFDSYRPELSKIFWRGTHRLLHNSSRANILRNVIFSGYVALYLIGKFFVNTLFFNYWQNVFCGRMETALQVGFGPRAVIWRTLIYTIKSSSDSTHHLCRSPTPTVHGCDLTRSTQTSEQEYSYLTASKRHPSTPYSRDTPQSFSRGTRSYTSRGRQNMCLLLWHAPRISWKFAEEWKFILKCCGRDENRTGCHTVLVQLFSRHLGIHCWEAMQRDVPAVGSFTPVSVVVYGDDQFVNLSVPFQNAMPLDKHESAKPSGVPSSPIHSQTFRN